MTYKTQLVLRAMGQAEKQRTITAFDVRIAGITANLLALKRERSTYIRSLAMDERKRRNPDCFSHLREKRGQPYSKRKRPDMSVGQKEKYRYWRYRRGFTRDAALMVALSIS